MATSDVSICNDALIIVGADKIGALTDTSKEGLLCAEQYEKVRDQLLATHPWNFAIGRKELANDASLPSGWWNWAYAFTLPADVLRILELQCETNWAVEGSKIFANDTPVRIKYIKKETDVSKYSKFFEKALAFELALRLSYAFVQNENLVTSLSDRAKLAVAEARSFDAQESGLYSVESEDWLNSRF